jgi:hypothetical protein
MDTSALLSAAAALRNSISTLESRAGSLESWLYFWVALVVIGVVLETGFVWWEYKEERKEFHRGTIRSPQRPSFWKLAFELIGAVLVAAGVAGELAIDVKAGSLQTELRNKNGELIQLLEGTAGRALKEAAAAIASNEQLGIDLETEKQKTARFQKEADMARLEISAQGPRWALLRKAAPELSKRLSRFAGQRVDFFLCGSLRTIDLETMSTWGAIRDSILGDAGAKWKIEHGGYVLLPNCTGSADIGVLVSSTANRVTRDAADALSTGLAIALLSDPNKKATPEDPNFAAPLISQGLWTKDEYWVVIANDPELIGVFIGAHPQHP